MSEQSITDFVSSLHTLKKRSFSAIQTSLYSDAKDVVNELKLRSPIDSGDFKSAWELWEGITSGNVIYSLSIQNNLPYALVLDEGVVEGGAPWYWPNANNPGPISSSGKLCVVDGRVWAGGKSPWGFAIGGLSDRVLVENESRLLRMATNIADAVMGVL